jgi:S1-C subfamily serine protease
MTEIEQGSPTDPTPPAPSTRPRSRHVVGLATVGALAVAATAAFGVHQASVSSTASAQSSATQGTSQRATFVPGYASRGFGAFGGGFGGTGSVSGTTAATTTATAAQQVGIVEINTVLSYQQAKAAGTGMLVTANGEILTNNHVVEGATSISVTIATTGATYTASVVGTDPTDDIAVLQLASASGLQTAQLSSAAVTVGEAVTGVGNAGGTGTLSAAPGAVTAVGQTITASDETGASAEQLSGLIETDAGIQAGDSGGPLYGPGGTVIGMDTAASSGGVPQGYAIPIATAETIAAKIEAGVDDSTIHQGYPAFLGISLQDSGSGVTVAGVLAGGPAAGAGITAGDVIASVGGTSVTSAASLSTAMARFQPGDRVHVTWTTAAGVDRSATVTLATGPAD